MKLVKDPKDIPEGHHYAIIIFKSVSVHIPGDERSRTNPGHGYPASTETYETNEYSFTHNHNEWIREIEKLEKDKALRSGCGFGRVDKYAAIEVAAKAKIETKVVVGVNK